MVKFSTIIAFFQLIRWQNLVIITGTQFLMRYGIISSLLGVSGMELQMPLIHFVILVFSTVCLTAAGYVINDYFDARIDMINKPEKVIIGTKISRRKGMALHILFNGLGIMGGIYVSFATGIPAMSMIFILIAGMLWFYSTTYKYQAFTGNFIVAVLTGFVPFVVILFEMPLLYQEYSQILVSGGQNLNYLISWVGAFSIFAFILTLAREIVKDAEDYEGDKSVGGNTLPILLGEKKTRHVINIILMVSIILMEVLTIRYLADLISIIYLNLGVVIPVMVSLILVYRAHTKKDFARISKLLKGVMALGVFYAILVRIIIRIQF